MSVMHSLSQLDNATLTERLIRCLADERQLTAESLRLIAEIDRRKLYVEAAMPSMFAYATQRLGLSEAAAYRRISVARAGRRFPLIFEVVARGRHHLSGLTVLLPHLTESNHRQLLQAAEGLSKREIEKLVAVQFPKPDVPTSLRKLPQPKMSQVESSGRPTAEQQVAVAAHPPQVESEPTDSHPPNGQALAPRMQLAPGRASAVANTPHPQQQVAVAAHPPQVESEPTDSHPPNGQSLAPRMQLAPGRASAVANTPHPQPLSASRYLLKVTVSEELYNKLQQIKELEPACGTAEILERAVDLLLTQKRKRKYALVDSPKAPTDAAARTRTRHIPSEIKREVYLRDGGQCTYFDVEGRRCPERGRLTYHHDEPYARGGEHTVDNIRLACHAHNQHYARHDFGAKHMERASTA